MKKVPSSKARSKKFFAQELPEELRAISSRPVKLRNEKAHETYSKFKADAAKWTWLPAHRISHSFRLVCSCLVSFSDQVESIQFRWPLPRKVDRLDEVRDASSAPDPLQRLL